MATVRETELLKSWRSVLKKKLISINELDHLMYQVDKLLQNTKDITESRDKWRKKYFDLKKSKKGGKKNGNK